MQGDYIVDHPDIFKGWAMPGTTADALDTFSYCYYQALAELAVSEEGQSILRTM